MKQIHYRVRELLADKCPEEFMKLMTLNPQPVKRQPTVEYLPI
jgi:hypothetical protein